MATYLAVKDGNAALVYISTTGAGTSGDPYVYHQVIDSGSILITNFPATQAVSAASLPLPSGAATVAKQPALGVAGTPSSDVISVQGVAGGVAQPVSGTVTANISGTIPVSGSVAATQSGTWTVQPGNTPNTTAWKVDGSAVTQPISGTQLPAVLGQGNMAQSMKVVLPTDQSAIPVTVSGSVPVSNFPTVYPVSGAFFPASLGQKAMASSFPVVIASDQTVIPASQSGTWTVQPGNTPNSTPWLVTQTPSTSGGTSIYRNLDSGSLGVSIKGSAGQIYGYYLYNNAANTRFVKLYNVSGTPVYTDTPVITIGLPAGAAANVAHPNGIAFATGIGIRSTTLVADTDQTQTTANDVVVNVYYK